MPRFIASAIVATLLTYATGVSGKPPAKGSEQVLLEGLQAMKAAITADNDVQQPSSRQSSAQPKAASKKDDHDQGDDHASDVAISRVCSHDNPSAQRSAICPRPNSPP